MMKFGPHRGATRAHDLHRKADAVRVGAAPLVVAMVRARRDELVDEIAFGSHDLDAVVAGALREARAARVGGDRSAHAPARQRARLERRDRRAHRGRRHRQRVIGIAPGVQDLQRDLASRGVHGVGDQPMPADLPRETTAATRAARAVPRNWARCRR